MVKSSPRYRINDDGSVAVWKLELWYRRYYLIYILILGHSSFTISFNQVTIAWESRSIFNADTLDVQVSKQKGSMSCDVPVNSDCLPSLV